LLTSATQIVDRQLPYRVIARWTSDAYLSCVQVRLPAFKVLYGIILVLGYTALIVWLTWPLAGSAHDSMASVGFAPFASHFDLYYSVWVLAHESYALVTNPSTFADANIYHPAQTALFYGPAAIGALPLFAPVFLWTGNPALAINVTFIGGLALTGATMHVVVRRWTGSQIAGVVGAVTVVANQWLVWGFVPTAPHWAALFWLPLIAFFAAHRLNSFAGVALLALVITAQCLTDLVYVTPAVMGPLGVLAFFRILRPGSRKAGLRLICALLLAGLALVPLYRGYKAVQDANPNLSTQTKWITTEASVPAVLPERLLRGGQPFLLTPVSIGLVIAGLIACYVRRRTPTNTPPLADAWAHGALWTLVGGCLAQNPVVVVAGREFTTPLAYFADWIPILQVIRVPSRLGIAGLVGLGILSGVAFAEVTGVIRSRVRRSIAVTCTIALSIATLWLIYRAYLDNHWTFTGPAETPSKYGLQPVPVIPDSFLPVLQSSQSPMIELPIGTDGLDPRLHARAMLHSVWHRRPILNGYSSYWPEGFAERMNAANRLPRRDALDHLVETTGVSLIWLHTQWLTPEQSHAWGSPPTPGNGERGLVVVARYGPEVLLAVEPAPNTVGR
jgi:hypothetical protein